MATLGQFFKRVLGEGWGASLNGVPCRLTSAGCIARLVGKNPCLARLGGWGSQNEAPGLVWASGRMVIFLENALSILIGLVRRLGL